MDLPPLAGRHAGEAGTMPERVSRGSGSAASW
jgi:hypothetical protein